MALHPSGFLNHSVELLRIETNLFDLYIQGKPFHPTVETLKLHREGKEDWIEATLQAVSRSPLLHINSVKVFSPEHGELIDGLREKILPCFYETQTYELVIYKKSEHELHFYHENVHLRKAVKPLGNQILSGMLNFQNEVGFTDLEIRINGGAGLSLRLEIFPSKLDYKSDYQAILNDVNKQIYNLSFDFLRKTFHFTGLQETNHQSLTEFFTIIQHVFDQLVQAVERIQTNPHHHLDKVHRVLDVAKVKRAGKQNITFLSKNPHLLERDDLHGMVQYQGNSYRPLKLIETKKQINYDTGENRFVRWMLQRIEGKLKQIGAKISSQDRKKDPVLQDKLIRMQRHLRRMLQMDFLQEVGKIQHMSVSLVLQMAPGYRDAYRIYLILMKGLSIQSDLFHLSMKDLAQLYEYWCFLKIHDLLSRKYKLVKQDVIRLNRSGLFVTLDKTQRARMEYENPRNGERFILYYNALPSEDKRNVPTLAQRPDNVLTLRKHDANNKQKVYKYVFDAKYRLNPAYEGTSYHQKYDGLPGPEEDDINTMHRYRDAIVYQEGEGAELERSMFGAYVLFPYGNEEQFRQHHFYKSIELVNIGAFPFLPNATSLMEQFMEELIQDSPEKAYERSTRPRGTTEYFKNKLGGKNVLVGSLLPGQLEETLKSRFYTMPLMKLRNHTMLTQLEYIALCQSRTQFGENAGIRYFGKIVDWNVLKGNEIKELQELPDQANELYVYFKLEAWQERKPEVALGGMGVERYLLTSKYMFDRAREIAELKLETEEELKVWREKRRQGPVKVKLDRRDVDLATKILWIEVGE